MRISELDDYEGKCTSCKDTQLKRVFLTPPNMTIPANMTHDGTTKVIGSPRGHNKRLPVPINIIDEKPDGGYKVTRIGNTKADIDND